MVEFDGREITYGFGELDELVLAYATTIHKSQGSEYPAVVIPLTTQHYPMLQRNLVYTGGLCTRIAGFWSNRRVFGQARITYELLAPIHNRLPVILPATHGASASAKRKRNPTNRSASSDHVQWN